jgi:hypothetical protein
MDPEKALEGRNLSIPKHILQLIVGMVRPNPNNRFSVERIMGDPWFDEVKQQIEHKMSSDWYQVFQ